MTQQKSSKQLISTKQLTLGALLTAMVVVLQLLGSFIRLGPVSVSLVLVPIVIGAALYGPGVGAFLGGVFSTVVIINCINGTDVGGAMVYQANPALCIAVVGAKGILAGFGAGLVYRLLKGKNPYLAMLCSAIVCPVVNTGVFVACMLLFFKDVLAAWAGGGDILAYVLTGLVLANFVPELIINVVFGTVGQRIIKTVKK